MSAEIKDFRVLRDVSIDFSIDPKKPVTIIRAENGFGKTTFLNAFQWLIGGDRAVGSGHAPYRFSPLDWRIDNPEKPKCTTSVEVIVKITDSEYLDHEKIYRVIRTRSETVSKKNEVSNNKDEHLIVFERTKEGDKEIPNPEQWVQTRMLPTEELDTFYVDGDFAESFIYDPNQTAGERSEKITQAIRSLLGMTILENAQTHLDGVRKTQQKKAADSGGDELEKLVDEYEERSAIVKELQEEIAELQQKKQDAEKNEEIYNNKRIALLKSGAKDRKPLAKKLESRQKAYKALPDLRKARQKALCNSFSSTELAKELISARLEKISTQLVKLEADGTIPDTLPEVIRDRLAKGSCICGASAKKGTPVFKTLNEALGEAEYGEEQVQILTHLHNQIKSWQYNFIEADKRESSLMTERFAALMETDSQEKTLSQEISEIEFQIKDIPDTDIEQVEQEYQLSKSTRQQISTDLSEKKRKLGGHEAVAEKLNKEISSYSAKTKKAKEAMANVISAGDLLHVVNETLEDLQTEVISEVSEMMNKIFIEIIFGKEDKSNADEQDRLIVGSRIQTNDNQKYEIVVLGADGATLDIAQAVNGASRRALTLSFILALTLVSSKVAPLLIDTPLGMSAGHVRERMANAAIRYSSQLVLLITSSELFGVTELLEDSAGKHYTLTNTSYYPGDLKNKPKQTIKGIETLVCNCSPSEFCKTCELTKAAK